MSSTYKTSNGWIPPDGVVANSVIDQHTTHRDAAASGSQSTISPFVITLFLLSVICVYAGGAQDYSAAANANSLEEVQVNEVACAAAGTRPIVIPLGQSSLVVIWEDIHDAQRFTQNTIYGQKFFYPAKVGKNISLSPIGKYSTAPDAVLVTSLKNILLTWQEYLITENLKSVINLRGIDSTISQFSSISLATKDSAAVPGNPRIASSTFSATMVWQQQNVRINSMLVILGADFISRSDTIRLNNSSSQAGLLPAVAMRKDSIVQAVWIDKGEAKRSIMMQQILLNGTRRGKNIRLNDFVEDRNVTAPEIVALPDNRSASMWCDARDGQWRAFVQFIDEEGFKLSSNTVVSRELEAVNFGDISIAAHENGKMLYVWETIRDRRATLAGQWFDADGAFLGKNFYVISRGDYDSRKPSVRFDHDAAYIVWLDNRYCDQPTQFDVFVKRIEIPSPPLTVEYISTPDQIHLHRNYPNPFGISSVYSSSRTNIVFEVARTSRVRVQIFNVFGSLIRTLTDTEYETGEHRIEWDGTTDEHQCVSSGMYFCRLESRGVVRSIKINFMR